ncbi:transcriptional regulator [Streptomyces sp. NPDC005925]|uniref:transcriptional regulator n=1 Tax=Streptomyces sp. NPDC005925 TaxID=3157172 RepID=UPI0033C43958
MVHTLGVPEARRDRFVRRLPATLEDLAGPARGTVCLPLHLTWSGLTRFDLDQPRLRMSCYRIVLAEGQRDDLVRYLNHDLLLSMWPVLRTLVSRSIREVWEDAFVELAGRARPSA